jgi:hypothetical protein
VTAVHLLAYLAPVLALVCVLLLGRFPGERAFRRRVARRRSRGRLRPLSEPHRHAPHRLLPRGGALLASALAGRAPPAGSV